MGNEHWMTLYQAAILEPDQAKLPEKIEASKAAIIAQARKPGLDSDEREALANALSGLRVLENEQTQYDAARSLGIL
jgi:hypothetical protein